ncbi:hypothetical protein C1645_813995 [Glomus cerebriforme]|uniref:Uncharacterized protein n=1 Tax=Glomus cerebriforme TaxID=658196 RepID=A0A397TH34_9GLOM|nr:hypothetical protein C1645_813995 [Glomus cerebriforme]
MIIIVKIKYRDVWGFVQQAAQLAVEHNSHSEATSLTWLKTGIQISLSIFERAEPQAR